MGIYIKDIEFPKSCNECKLKAYSGTILYGVDIFCVPADKKRIWHGTLPENYKPDWCPVLKEKE